MSQELKKFKPERPIYLNEQNTGFKTKVEVILAVEQLRSAHYLCAYGEKTRPFHMSFNTVKEFQEFKKTANGLGIKLKEPLYKADDIEALEAEESDTNVPEESTATSTYESTSGKVVIE